MPMDIKWISLLGWLTHSYDYTIIQYPQHLDDYSSAVQEKCAEIPWGNFICEEL